MIKGCSGKERTDTPLDVQGGGNGQSIGVPADGQLEGHAYTPTHNPGVHHWQASYVERSGIDDRGNIYFAAVAMTRMPILITDPNLPDNPVVFVNGAFLDLTGYTEEQVIGRNCRFMQGKDTNAATVDEIRQALSEYRAVAVDILNYKASGQSFWNALFIGPVFDHHGKLLYYFASSMDITSRRMSEQQLLQSQKMEAIGQLTAGIAHDFNNLLQIVSGNLDIASAPDDPDSGRQALERALTATNKAAKLTKQLLSFARKQRLHPRAININELIVSFSEMLVSTVGSKIDLNMDLCPMVLPTIVDPTHLEMALLNVLINARDAMPKGGKVTVGTTLLNEASRLAKYNLPPGSYIVLCVHDNGIGMSPDVVSKATEPFFTTKSPGTGLGLAMVQGFVQQSNGRLEIESEPGKGTLIRMIFPAASEKVATVPPVVTDLPAADAAEKTSARKKTILVVDDSMDVAELAGSYLRSNGYDVLYAHNGEEAIEAFDKHGHVDMVFSDIVMGDGMNGVHLAEQLRTRRADLPVLLASGYMDDLADDPATLNKLAAMDILSKPYRQNEVLKYVRAALDGGPRPKPAHFLR